MPETESYDLNAYPEPPLRPYIWTGEPTMPNIERYEGVANAFRERYGLSPEDTWTNEQIDRALADSGMPSMDRIPAEPSGVFAEVNDPAPDDPVRLEMWRNAWNRTNAMHLIAHAMVHGGERCGGCVDWGQQ